jgi:hypothetical protein
VRHHHIPSRPHVQGSSAPIRLRHSARDLTDGAGLLTVRRLWDELDLGRWIDDRSADVAGRFRSTLMVELWVALLLYGGSVLDDLLWFRTRGVRALFGWTRIPDPTTFGRWLRRAGEPLVPILDELIWHLVRVRWEATEVPRTVTLVLDSTVAVRYGTKQAGAEKGYNPKKRGRPSHHPLVATLAETGDLMGVRWRPGSASAARGAPEWLEVLVARLREAGVEEITVRLDKGFFSKAMVECLGSLKVHFLLKVPDHHWVRRELGSMRRSAKSLEITKDPALRIWSAGGTLYGARLLSLEWRRTETGSEELFDRVRITQRSHVLTNLPGIHALTAWRAYNDGAVVEQRIEELAQLGAGRTAVDDLGGNALLWQMAALAYQLLHVLRTTALQGAWRRAQPNRIRTWLFRLPGKITRHARKLYVQLLRREPLRPLLLQALRRVAQLRAPPDQLATA